MGQRITELAEILSAEIDDDDPVVLVSRGDMSMAASGTDRRASISEFASAVSSRLDPETIPATPQGSLVTTLLKLQIGELETLIANEVAARIAADDSLQPEDSDLTAIAALATTAFGRGLLILADAAALRGAAALGTAATATVGTGATELPTTADVQALIDAVIDGAPGALNTLLELANALGDDPNFATTITNALAGKQPIDSDLTSIAALTTTTFGRAFLELADAAAGRAHLGLVIGTDVQGFDVKLASIAGLSPSANQGIYFTSSSAVDTFDLSAFARTVLDDPNAATARTTLEVPSNAESILQSLLTTRGDVVRRGAAAAERLALGAARTALASNGIDAVWDQFALMLDFDAAFITLENSDVETSLISSPLTAPAGSVKAGDLFMFVTGGALTNNTGAPETCEMRFKVTANAITPTLLNTLAVPTFAASINARRWYSLITVQVDSTTQLSTRGVLLFAAVSDTNTWQQIGIQTAWIGRSVFAVQDGAIHDWDFDLMAKFSVASANLKITQTNMSFIHIPS